MRMRTARNKRALVEALEPSEPTWRLPSDQALRLQNSFAKKHSPQSPQLLKECIVLEKPTNPPSQPSCVSRNPQIELSCAVMSL